MPSCNICGSVHDSEGGVVQHIFASKDNHEEWDEKGEIWKNADDLINDSELKEEQQSETDSDKSDNADSNATVKNPNDNPVMGKGDADEDTFDEDDETEVDLPCGHESFEIARAPEPPFGVECDVCGKSWVVTDD